MAIDPESFYKPQEVANTLGCSLANVYNLMRSAQVARTKIGAGKTGFRIRGSDLLTFIEEATWGGPMPWTCSRISRCCRNRYGFSG